MCKRSAVGTYAHRTQGFGFNVEGSWENPKDLFVSVFLFVRWALGRDMGV